jgi:putative colanic acid biosynthesis UDP-glucose lipid carrier transferase
MFAWIGLLLDSMTIVLSGLAAWWWVLPDTHQPLIYAVLVLLTLMAWVLMMPLMGLNRSSRAASYSDWMLKLATTLGLISLVVVISLWAFKLAEDFSRLWLALWFSTSWIFLIGWRLAAFSVLKRLRASGYNHKHIVIVGAGRLGQAIQAQIQASPWSGFEVAAFFDDDADKIATVVNGVEVKAADDLSGWLDAHPVDEIWFALPLRAEPRLQALLHALRHTTANIRYVPNLSGLRLLNHAPREVLGFSMLDLSVSPMSEPFNRLLKSLEDKVIAGLILLLISPIMLLLAIGVKLSSPGPVFYRQERVGLNGELFNMLKFRSMPVDVEKDGVQWGSAGSKTNTWFGAFIRKTSLDELPQFINVLKGDMSIVGPRPERPMFVEQFKDEIPGYMQKHMVKAGITGWAQVHGWRGDTCLKTRIEFDLWYVEHWSLWLDIKIIIMTLFKGFVHSNAR